MGWWWTGEADFSFGGFFCCTHIHVSSLSPYHRSIVGFTDHCSTSILLAAYGNGSSEVESTPVMRGGAWSCAHLLEQPLCLHYSVQSEEQVAQLPTDFQVLCRTGNLHSFLAVPITTDHEVLGALTIAKEDPEGFEVDWCVRVCVRACVSKAKARLRNAYV